MNKGLTRQIETGVQDHRHAGPLVERADQIIPLRVLDARDGLRAARVIDVNDGRDFRHPFGLGGQGVEHPRRRGEPAQDKPIGRVFRQHRGREGSIPLAFLDPVDNVLAFGNARIEEDASVAEGPGAHFRPALKDRSDLPAKQTSNDFVAGVCVHIHYPIDDWRQNAQGTACRLIWIRTLSARTR